MYMLPPQGVGEGRCQGRRQYTSRSHPGPAVPNTIDSHCFASLEEARVRQAVVVYHYTVSVTRVALSALAAYSDY